MRFKSRRPAHGYMRRRSDFSDYPEVFLLTAFKMNTPITKMGKSVLKLRNPTGSPKSRFASINKPTNQAATVDNTAARYILSAPFVVFLETAGKKTVKTGDRRQYNKSHMQSIPQMHPYQQVFEKNVGPVCVRGKAG